MSHPFRFSVQASSAPDAKGWTDLAKKVEDLGYSTLFMPDHFGDQFAPGPALAHAAAVTSTLKIGALVLDTDYRHPVVAAKELATLDVLSNGRLEIGLGAGWMTSDYEQSGIPLDRPGVRIERCREHLEVIRGLFADGACNHEGTHYTITDLDGGPKPVQKPCPPVLIGGGGPKMLGFAAAEADIVGVSANLRSGVVGPEAAADLAPERIDEKLEIIKAAAGDRFDDIELNTLVFAVVVTDDAQGTAEAFGAAFGMDAENTLASPAVLIGTTGEIADRLRERRDRWGMSYVTVQADALDAMAPVVAELAGT